MAVLISCQELSKSFGARPLFDGLTLGIAESGAAASILGTGSPFPVPPQRRRARRPGRRFAVGL